MDIYMKQEEKIRSTPVPESDRAALETVSQAAQRESRRYPRRLN